TQPFWDSVRAHAMAIQWCAACERYVFYPRALCPYCLGSALAWRPISGRGTLYAFTIVHRALAPEFQPDVPYVVALVELDEGIRLMTTIADVPPDPAHVRMGMPVEVAYDDITAEVTLPRFQPL
ncbi:MAG: OB-fold domain-containing protein, partial [Chloroflexi bacterium]|nr:OB-fold domain-containing protein [Chloroflexota bacterium]